MGICCPLGCLRWTVFGVSLVVAGCGGLIVWLGRRLQKQEITKGADVEYYALVIIAFGGWLVVVGIIGVASALRKFNIGLSAFALSLFATTLVLIALAGVGLNISQSVNSSLESGECKGNDYLRQVDDTVMLANVQLCSEVCPCNVTETTFGEAAFANLTIGDANRIQDCNPCSSLAPEVATYREQPGYCKMGGRPADFKETFYSPEERRFFDLIIMLEDEYDCAGLCSDARFFAFTRVSRGTPIRNCKSDLQTWVQRYPMRYCAVIIGVSLLLFFSGVLPCCIVFHPLRSSQHSGYSPAAKTRV